MWLISKELCQVYRSSDDKGSNTIKGSFGQDLLIAIFTPNYHLAFEQIVNA